MKKPFSMAAAIAALSISFIGGAAGVAHAATVETDFPGKANRLTLFDDYGYKDNFTVIEDTTVPRLESSPYRFNDKTSSLVNKTSRYIMVYDDINYADTHYCIVPHSHINNLLDPTYGYYGWNDKISSVKVLTQSASSCGTTRKIGDPNNNPR